jgi:hypothetical protein
MKSESTIRRELVKLLAERAAADKQTPAAHEYLQGNLNGNIWALRWALDVSKGRSAPSALIALAKNMARRARARRLAKGL